MRFLLGVIAVSAFAQTSGLQGLVTDPSGAAVPGVELRLVNAATGVSSTATTNDSGFYSVPLLPQGTYRITAAKAGFS
ncbi:MAG: carboxypeptidase regulatory-like domain-containing protein, partial [Acidobacteria bacterium]|nr:carboxypeptidase regulatory-like domain-containing protein [Acidobacteriota bacterium]